MLSYCEKYTEFRLILCFCYVSYVSHTVVKMGWPSAVGKKGKELGSMVFDGIVESV